MTEDTNEDPRKAPRQDSGKAKFVADQSVTDGGATAQTAFQRKEEKNMSKLPLSKPDPAKVSPN